MKTVTPLLLAVLSLAACKKEAAPTTPDNTGGDPGQSEPSASDAYACETAEDCVAVELECCDACNGGDAVAVHKEHVDAVVADSARAGGCDGVACTKMACPDWVPACEAGKCAITRGSF